MLQRVRCMGFQTDRRYCNIGRLSSGRSLLNRLRRYSCRSLSRISLLTLLLLTIVVPRAWAQTSSTGALIGDVLDSSGRGIPQAAVNINNQQMAVGRSSISDDNGHFTFPLL